MRKTLLGLLVSVSLIRGAYAQDHYWGEELNPIFEALAQDTGSGLLELSQQYDSMRLPTLPQFRRITENQNSSLNKLRKIIASVPGMHVTESANRVFVMKQRGVPQDVLDIRIGHLTFEDYCFRDIYSANRALAIVLQAPEVSAYSVSNDISFGPRGGGIGRGSGCGLPPSGRPHFSASVDNVTVAQAFERVLKEFPGEILVYWNFPKEQHKKPANPSQHHRPQSLFPNFFAECHQSSRVKSVSETPSPDLPDPLCLPATALPAALPECLLMQQWPPYRPAQRIVFFQFFYRKQVHGKTLITSG